MNKSQKKKKRQKEKEKKLSRRAWAQVSEIDKRFKQIISERER